MCDVKKCCFCIPLKVGVYLAASYTMFFSSLALVAGTWILASHISLVPETEEAEQDGWDTAYTRSFERSCFIAAVCFYALWLLFGIMMTIGAANRVRGLLMPWVVLTSVVVAFELLAIPLAIYYYVHAQNHLFLINIGMMCGGVFLNVMSLIGVTAHFRKMGEQTPTLSIYGDQLPAPYGQYKYHIQA